MNNNLNVENESASGLGRHVIQYPDDISFCAGCSACEIVCGLVHEGVSSPSVKRIFLERGEKQSLQHAVLTCHHCDDPPCYEKCPKKDKAMCIDERGIVYIDQDECIGCGMCAKACKFEPSRINFNKKIEKTKRKAYKCDLCRTRENGPACIEYCQVKCIGLSDLPIPAKKEQ
ncbi:4Fe-4S dicluster domain-containing protein [Eubacteriaceae bacterium ES2]|nr:4Fe-4S dicluster domain-containing protein [Eubacteriaceae bacterium ES2]